MVAVLAAWFCVVSERSDKVGYHIILIKKVDSDETGVK